MGVLRAAVVEVRQVTGAPAPDVDLRFTVKGVTMAPPVGALRLSFAYGAPAHFSSRDTCGAAELAPSACVASGSRAPDALTRRPAVIAARASESSTSGIHDLTGHPPAPYGARMYVPGHFREERLNVLRALVAAHPLATLVSPGRGGLLASHLPMLWDPEPAPWGTLVGHLARANPHASDAAPDAPSLAVFVGPQAYVSPSWYPSKSEHAKVVPTWNYVAVHVTGALRIVDDRDWLRDLVGRLTATHEAALREPWRVTDAPADYVERMLRAIVGVALPVAKVEGKWKLSQNRAPEDVAGTITGLGERADPGSVAVARAMMDRRGGVRSAPRARLRT